MIKIICLCFFIRFLEKNKIIKLLLPYLPSPNSLLLLAYTTFPFSAGISRVLSFTHFLWEEEESPRSVTLPMPNRIVVRN